MSDPSKPSQLSPSATPNSPTETVRPSPTQRRSFLGKIPSSAVATARRIPKPSRLLQLRGGNRRGTNRAELLVPDDPSAKPLGTLVVRVFAGRGLTPKDKNGSSDPFVVIRFGSERTSSPHVAKNLNPVWGTSVDGAKVDGAGGEAKLSTTVWESRGFGRERVEIVVWDKDRLGKEYMGEMSLGVENWWPHPDTWKDGKPPVGFHDANNSPIWHQLRSARSKTQVTGELLVQIGFIPAAVAAPAKFNTESTSSLASALAVSAAPALGLAQTPSKTELSSEQRARIMQALQNVADEAERSRRASKEERVLLSSPIEGVGMKGIEDQGPIGLVAPHVPRLAPIPPGGSSSDSGSETDDESSETDSEDDDDEIAGLGASSTEDEDNQLNITTDPLRESPAPELEPAPSAASSVPSIVETPAPPHLLPEKGSSTGNGGRKKVLGIFKRAGSNKSVQTLSSTSGAAAGETSDMEAATSGADEAASGKGKGRKRFTRRKPKRMDTSDSAAFSESQAEVEEPKKRKKRRGLKRRKRDTGYQMEEGDEIVGLVTIEVNSAKDLPKWRNMLKTGWDMDPFVVISFGRKVFRTKVIRHSLNPTWDQKLVFHVRKTETAFLVAFNVYDWDKISSNDHVGDVTVQLSDLLGLSIQPDERGLYAMTKEGKLVGDDLHEHELKLIAHSGDKEKDAENDPAKTGASAGTLTIKAKVTPYGALRQQFWKTYIKNYDIDESGTMSHIEIYSMLDSLGSTLTRETIDSFFTRYGKSIDDHLTIDEVVLCVEAELAKPLAEKKAVDEPTESTPPTPGYPGPGAVGTTGPLEIKGVQEPLSIGENVSSSPEVLSGNMEKLSLSTKGDGSSSSGTKTPAHRQDSSASTMGGDEAKLERVINIKACPLCHKQRMNSRAEVDIVTHMAICASTDPRAVNRVLVSNYVTASQAQRKWFTKVISKATKGAYQLGANSANIIVQDRRTGTLLEEKMAVYVRLGMRLMYQGIGPGGGLEGSRIRKMLESMSVKQGIKFNSPQSVRDIEPFIQFHNLDLNEVKDPMDSFKNFNEFFYRKLKPDARPLADPDDPTTLVSPADCRAMFFESIDEATKIWIKGREFSVKRLLGDKYGAEAAKYEGGSLAIFRLAPQDYHRYHSPVDGVCGEQHKIAGQYYTVNPMAIRGSIDVYGENVRLVMPIESEAFGKTMMVFVGAMMVGTICMSVAAGDHIGRGEELGYFAFGGSTIVIVWEKGKIKFDDDLLGNSRHAIETLVRMGMRIGKAV